MDLREELKNLSFQMMLNETKKMQIENGYYFDKKINRYGNSKKVLYDRLINCDRDGYKLSLQFNELLLQNGYKFNAFDSGPDSVNISAENLLNKFGLAYPITWYVVSEDRNGLHFGYDSLNTIENKHNEFLSQVEKLFENGKLDKYEKERILVCAEYYKGCRCLLEQYQTFIQKDVFSVDDVIGKKL